MCCPRHPEAFHSCLFCVSLLTPLSTGLWMCQNVTFSNQEAPLTVSLCRVCSGYLVPSLPCSDQCIRVQSQIKTCLWYRVLKTTFPSFGRNKGQLID